MTMLAQAFVALLSIPLVKGQADGDWFNNWDGVQETRTSVGPFSSDSRASFRGSGTLQINNGVMTMTGNPRFYVSNVSTGWKNVEITGYATWLTDGTDPDPNDTTGLSNVSGFHLAARTDHDLYKEDGCEAFGYYAILRRNSGACSFSKEYYHDVRKMHLSFLY